MSTIALILAGGFATRLRPLSYTRPKPLLQILNRPIIDYILEKVVNLDVDTIYISVRYMAEKIIEHVDTSWENYKDKIQYLIEDRPLGDAGPLKFLVNKAISENKTILVLNGDIFSNIELGEVLRFHKKKGGIATLVLTRVTGDLSRYGVATVDAEQRIVSFVEKPKDARPEGLVNAGVYIFEPEVFNYIEFRDDRPMKLSIDVIPRLLKYGDVYGFIHEGYWFDIGTPEDYLRANFTALEYMCLNDNSDCIKGVCEGTIHEPCFIDDGVYVKKDSEIGPYTIILRGSRIEGTVKISNSILLNHVTVNKGTYITGAIIGEHTYIGKWVRIESGTVIGDYTYIADNTYIARGAKIGPHREITESIYKEGAVLP